MRAALPRVIFALCIALSAGPAHAECTPGRSTLGAVIGGAIGTFIFPGVGTAVGAVLLGGGTCAVDWWTAR